MTVIAWDGNTLAADKRSVNNGFSSTVTKIRRIRGHLVGVAGEFAVGMALFNWFENGAIVDQWPKLQESDDWCPMLVITPDGRINRYEKTPFPMTFEDKEYAMGSGRDYALAAMHLGYDAVEAVKVASALDAGCGNGIDALTLEESP